MSLADAIEPASPMRPGTKTTYLFGIGFTIAAALAATAVWLASRGGGAEDFDRPLRMIYGILAINLVIILGLGALAVWRVRFLIRQGDVGAKLHLRFMTQFAFAAVAPAVVVAFFFGILVNQGVDSWFSDRVRTVVENNANISQTLVDFESARLDQALGPAANQINTAIGRMSRAPEDFEGLLRTLNDDYGFRSIYVIDRSGRILAKAEAAAAPAYVAPDDAAFPEVEQTHPDDAELATALRPSSAEDLMRILFQVPNAPGVYAWVVAPMPTGLLARLQDAAAATNSYRAAEAKRSEVQAVFMASYVETALIVLLGAIWLGMAAASAITEPVARLVKAADKVAAGDLSVWVETESQLEAIETLSHSFNRMTDDIKQQQAELVSASVEAENRRQFIETVLSGVSAGVLGLDSAGRISAINRQAARLLGVREEDARGASLADIGPEFTELVAIATETGAEAEMEIDLLRGAEARRLRVRAAGDARDGLVLTFDDITRLVTAQRNAAWKDVARRIAHEIKNPLTPIQLSAERLRRKYRKEISSDLETFDRCTDTIVRQVSDIGRMVDEFSAFARMPAPKFGSCDAVEMLRAAVFAQRVANPEIDIQLEDQAEPRPVVCDDRMIGQALTNVLKNAAEAIEAKLHAHPAHKSRIVARLRDDGDNLVYEVEDNGVGLPAKDRARLAEPYVTTREKGTGLGLAIVKRIMEDHGGTLTLRDGANGEGALVALSFPRGEATAAPQPLVAEA